MTHDLAQRIAKAGEPSGGVSLTPHYHQAKYVDGVLVRECNLCEHDLMHESHFRSPNHHAIAAQADLDRTK